MAKRWGWDAVGHWCCFLYIWHTKFTHGSQFSLIRNTEKEDQVWEVLKSFTSLMTLTVYLARCSVLGLHYSQSQYYCFIQWESKSSEFHHHAWLPVVPIYCVPPTFADWLTNLMNSHISQYLKYTITLYSFLFTIIFSRSPL